LYRESDDGDMPRVRAELVERCPQFFALSHERGKLKAGFDASRPADRVVKNEF
jgi:hypothetical protein